MIMAEGRSKDDWLHTSSILCFLAEPYRDRKRHRQAFRPDDFNPHVRKPKQEKIKVGIEALRVFLR